MAGQNDDIIIYEEHSSRHCYIVCREECFENLSPQTLEMYLKMGCDPNYYLRSYRYLTNSRDKIPLIFEISAKNNCIEKISILLKYGADINLIDKFGNNLLHDIAMYEGFVNGKRDVWEAVRLYEFLLDNGIDIYYSNDSGYNVFDIIMQNRWYMERNHGCKCERFMCGYCRKLARYEVLECFLRGYFQRKTTFFELMFNKIQF